jgi:hypothetical protein
MRLLTRIAFIWIVLGLLTGLFLRTRRQLSVTWLIMLSFAPWFLHQLYLLLTLEFALPPSLLIVFLGISVLLTIIGAGVVWYFAKKRSPAVAGVPLLHGILYSISLLVLERVTQVDALGINSISWVVFASATLYVSSLLLSYLFRIATPKLPNFSLKRTRK